MSKYLIEFSMDGYESEQEEAAASKEYIHESLDFSASSLKFLDLDAEIEAARQRGFEAGLHELALEYSKETNRGYTAGAKAERVLLLERIRKAFYASEDGSGALDEMDKIEKEG